MAPLGVAEAGAIWLTQDSLVVNALGVLSQHLVVLLDPARIVDSLHDAYGQLDLTASPYGVFLAGPSATGDIEGVIIHGAPAGARSLDRPCSSHRSGDEDTHSPIPKRFGAQGTAGYAGGRDPPSE